MLIVVLWNKLRVRYKGFIWFVVFYFLVGLVVVRLVVGRSCMLMMLVLRCLVVSLNDVWVWVEFSKNRFIVVCSCKILLVFFKFWLMLM